MLQTCRFASKDAPRHPSLIAARAPARIISAAGADHEFAVSLSVGFHVDGAVAPYAFRGRWLVTDCVLVSDVVSDAAADLVHFIERAR